jgi:hypothetical protein
MPQALSPSDWAAIRAAYESGAETPVEIARRFKIHYFPIYNRLRSEQWVQPEVGTSDGEPQPYAPGFLPHSPLDGEGRGGGCDATNPRGLKHPTPHDEIAQRALDVVIPFNGPLKGEGGGTLEGLRKAKIAASAKKPTVKPKRPKQPPPKHQGMIDRLYRVIDSNLSQLEDIMKNQSDPSIADNEKETRTIGTVIGNIEKLKGLEDDAGKSNSRANKSSAPTDTAAETERLGRELAERLVRLSKDLRA